MVVLALFAAGCSGTSAAQEHAIKACDLARETDDKTAETSWRMSSERSLDVWDVWDDLSTLKSRAERWTPRAAEAAAAVQIDLGFEELSRAVSVLASDTNFVVDTRMRNPKVEGKYPNSALFDGLGWYGQRAENYNRSLEIWRTECSGLVVRLN